MAVYPGECGHSVTRKGAKQCRACWAARGADLPPEAKIQLGECGHPVTKAGVKLCRACWLDQGQGSTVDEDRAKQRAFDERASLKRKYDDAIKTIERQERELRALDAIGRGLETYAIKPSQGKSQSEGTVVMVASDWHIEERVGAEVGGLNRYDMAIAQSRADQFFRAGTRLTRLLAQDLSISTIILPLLGDFISGDIHEEVAEVAEVAPIFAVVNAQNWIASGVEYLLAQTACEIVIVCHSGNHGRTTKTTRFATENGHSLEYLMYQYLAVYFRDQPRVRFIIPDSYHSYVQVYDQTIRFHHGHAVKYGGGVGGIYIPVNKAISQWNKGRRADLDVFGHFHQMRDGGNFICNGSLIGYNAYALSIKADYEPPRQALFLMDRDRGRTCMWPILFGADKKARAA